MSTHVPQRPIRILVINPNSSTEMTKGIEHAINEMGLPDLLEITTYTAPAASPASINNDADIEASTRTVWSNLVETNLLSQNAYDGVLVACYSVHTLVSKIAGAYPSLSLSVTGIFETSIWASLPLLRNGASWGIVTTGKFWEHHLASGVQELLGQGGAGGNGNANGKGYWRFAGVESTGLDAGDFHGDVPAEEIRRRLEKATKRLLGHGGVVRCIIMGCAGMAGLEEIIRAAAVSTYGETAAREIYVVDGVKAGIGVLEQMIINKRMFRKA